ncbi:Ankyrin [Coniochaeta hoffmannii]|uniref:Ankyrin n=1 Tax=Coniochaeta hoffmannii TaxID=91930 RepID=A0AA38RMW0_9PEZI|nr:Ankyrin [Coniochaeta hoffmannii]
MAELAGLFIGIAAFALQIGGTIESIRALREFTPAEVVDQLECLSDRLELFRKNLLALQPLESHPTVKSALQQASKRFRVVENALQKLQRKLHPEGNARPGYRIRVKLVFSRQHVEEQINKAKDNISGMSVDVQLACLVLLSLQHLQASGSTVIVHRIDSSLEESRDAAMTQESRINTEPSFEESGAAATAQGSRTYLEKSGDAAMIHESAIGTGQAVAETTSAQCEQSQVIPRGTNRHHCGQRHCDCLCHLTGKKSGRFWSVEYTPLSILLKKPKNGRCGSSQFCLNFRLALSKLGIPFAIVAGLNITADAIGFNLQPALRTERFVKYTSPGFETLCRLQYGNISLGEARTKFVELYRSDTSLKDHRDPSGQSYLQELLMYPWPFRSMDQLALLRMFVAEFDMTLVDQDSSFLTMCATWIGEGPHLDLLDAILEYGFNPTTVHSPLWEQWPASCSPNWWSELDTPDPFFVEYLAMLVKDNPYFSGSTPLCNAVLVGSDKDIEAWMLRTQPLRENTTFLGQSPLHLAITNPDVCRLLLDAGHDLDSTDKWGATPLMYAAAMGQRQTVTLLLSRGANPTIFSCPNGHEKSHRTFVHYAIARGHTDLVLDALGTIQEVYGIEAAQAWSQLATLLTIGTGGYFLESRTPFLLELIKNLANVNMPIGDQHEGVDDNNLMHYVVSVDEASALVRCGFNQFDSPNSDGKLAINSLAQHFDPALIKFCIESGTSVRNKDKEGRTILFDLFSTLHSTAGLRTQQTLTAIRLCLDAGADIFETDNCRCSYENIAGIQEDESEFIDILEGEIKKLASESLHCLWSEWMFAMKAEYDAHVVAMDKKRAEYKPPLPMPPDYFQVDYKNDTYKFGPYIYSSLRAYPITSTLASYAFWLQYEYRSPDFPLLGEVRRAGWFEKRVSWLQEFISVMALSADEVATEMRRIHKQELARGTVSAECNMDLDFLV